MELLLVTLRDHSYIEDRILYFLNIAQYYQKLKSYEKALNYFEIASSLIGEYEAELYIWVYQKETDSVYLNKFQSLRKFRFIYTGTFDEYVYRQQLTLPGHPAECMKFCFDIFREMIEMERKVLQQSPGLESDFSSNTLRVEKRESSNPNDSISSKAVDLIFYLGEEKIGEASVSGIDTKEGFFYNFEISKKYRGHGYGSLILDWCLQHYSITELTVRKDNETAIHIYKKFGFHTYQEIIQDGHKMLHMKRK